MTNPTFTTKQSLAIVKTVNDYEAMQSKTFLDNLENVYMPLAQLLAYRDDCKASFKAKPNMTKTAYMQDWDCQHGLRDMQGNYTIPASHFTHARWLGQNLELAKETAKELGLSSLARVWQAAKENDKQDKPSKGKAATTKKGKDNAAIASDKETQGKATNLYKALALLMPQYGEMTCQDIDKALPSIVAAMLKDNGLENRQWLAWQEKKSA